MKNKTNKTDKTDKTDKTETLKNDMTKSWEWFIEHGYTDPKEMIDHNGNLDVPETFMQLFVAYNQHNIAEGKAWETWPEWELSLTSMKEDLQCAYNQEVDSEVIKTERQHWFAAMQFMHEHGEISFDGYTIIIKGQHGNTFSFDFALGNETWGAPGTYAAQKVILDTNAKKPKAWMWGPQQYKFSSYVGHSLGPNWQCPEHIPTYGGECVTHTPESTFLMTGPDETFPGNLLSLMQMCIDDSAIWKIQYEYIEKFDDYDEGILNYWRNGRRGQEWNNLNDKKVIE